MFSSAFVISGKSKLSWDRAKIFSPELPATYHFCPSEVQILPARREK